LGDDARLIGPNDERLFLGEQPLQLPLSPLNLQFEFGEAFVGFLQQLLLTLLVKIDSRFEMLAVLNLFRKLEFGVGEGVGRRLDFDLVFLAVVELLQLIPKRF